MSKETENLLQDAIVALLRRIPERWAEYDIDALTATESQALSLLVAAGMVERRGRFRLRLHNHPVAVEGTFTATGEYGFVEAMEPLLAHMWSDWQDTFHAWQTNETGSAPPVLCENLKPDEWRLTDQGTLARADLDADRPDTVVDFVLRRGFFDGQPRIVEGRITAPKSPRGTGRLVDMRKVQADSVGPADVNIGNWQEGADAFADAFKAMCEAGGCSGGLPDPAGGTAHETPRPAEKTVNDDSHLSATRLAEMFDVPADALRTRLNRWRQYNHAGWIENSERGPREAKYLYCVGTVRPIIDAMKATSETTSERPAKKN